MIHSFDKDLEGKSEQKPFPQYIAIVDDFVEKREGFG